MREALVVAVTSILWGGAGTMTVGPSPYPKRCPADDHSRMRVCEGPGYRVSTRCARSRRQDPCAAARLARSHIPVVRYGRAKSAAIRLDAGRPRRLRLIQGDTRPIQPASPIGHGAQEATFEESGEGHGDLGRPGGVTHQPHLAGGAPPWWHWRGRRVRLVDGPRGAWPTRRRIRPPIHS